VCGSQGGDAVICLYHTTTLEYEVQYVHATYVRTYYDLSDKAAEPEQVDTFRFEFKSDYLFGVMRTFCT
jgi:hypothetical protein